MITNRGFNYAQFQTYKEVIKNGFDYVLAIEDDTPIAPDCLKLVRWFMDRNGSVLNAFSKSKTTEGANDILVSNVFCPWVWAFKAKFFHDVLQPKWMSDSRGWDWSMQAAILELGIQTFVPRVSRSANIGRLGGVHYTPEAFDADFTGCVMSDGLHTDYRITE